jgi:UDP-N-acetyl-D-mannosaminuronic acid dehydrogenase
MRKDFDICVIGGGGHVGLPLAVAFAGQGLRVVIHDINRETLARIDAGEVPFLEEGCEPALRQVIGRTLFTSDHGECIRQAKYLVLVIGTPVDEHLNPRFSQIHACLDEIKPFLDNDHLLILRSTVAPGVSAKVDTLLRRDFPGLRTCFCPERILEGHALEELRNLPQIVSGFDEAAVAEVSALFQHLTPDIIRLSPAEAELAKLFTNSWRYLQFATANQFYMIAEDLGLDFYRIYQAMTHNYPRTKGFPRPGFSAGPCLFKDTMQLSATMDHRFFLGHSAMLVNEGLPDFLVKQAKRNHDLAGMTSGILGMAFKAESDDRRESLSYRLKKVLQLEALDVLCADEYMRDDPGLIPAEEVIRRADILFIGAPHKRYAKLDFLGKPVIDVWNLLGRHGIH